MSEKIDKIQLEEARSYFICHKCDDVLHFDYMFPQLTNIYRETPYLGVCRNCHKKDCDKAAEEAKKHQLRENECRLQAMREYFNPVKEEDE